MYKKITPLLASGVLLFSSINTAMAEPELAFSGAIEMEAAYSDDEIAGEISSDIALATVELGLDAKVTEQVSGRLLFLYEDDQGDDNTLMDEAVITLQIPDSSFYLSAGRQYVPFGNFESHMVSDPLTLELAETREDTLLVGFEQGAWYGSAYLFNGDADKTGVNADKVDDYGANIGRAVESEGMSLDMGLSMISNLADTDALQEVMPAGGIQRHSMGLSAYAIMSQGPLTVIGEYVTATKTIKQVDFPYKGKSAKPSALNLELAVAVSLAGKEATLAVAHQQSAEAVSLGLPESRNMVSLSFDLMEGAALGLEYAQATDYNVSDGGTGNDASGFTAQLAIEF